VDWRLDSELDRVEEDEMTDWQKIAEHEAELAWGQEEEKEEEVDSWRDMTIKETEEKIAYQEKCLSEAETEELKKIIRQQIQMYRLWIKELEERRTR
jgi:hypothetical protein